MVESKNKNLEHKHVRLVMNQVWHLNNKQKLSEQYKNDGCAFSKNLKSFLKTETKWMTVEWTHLKV